MKQNKSSKKPKPAVGGLVGSSSGGRIENSHFEGKIRINGNQKDVNVGGLVGRSENTEIVNSSANAKIEFANETEPSEPIFEIKPNIYGIGVNVRALLKRVLAFLRKSSY